jgi:DNA-binding IclR family transcriptional regulator
MDDHTVVGRAVAILDCVAGSAGPLPLAALTRRTGIPKATVRRIANDLTARGMLELTPDGYVAGSRLINQGLRSAHHRGTVLSAQPYLQDLHLQTRGEIAWFATMEDGDLSMTTAAFGRSHLPLMRGLMSESVSKRGTSMVILAAGRLLAAHEPELADRILATGWKPLTRYSVTDRPRMRDLLLDARDTGLARESEQTLLGWTCLAAALREPSGRLMGVIGVSGRGSNIDARGVRPTLTMFAESLAAELIPRSGTEGHSVSSQWPR